MKQKIMWGGEWHHHYKTHDMKYDILHIEKEGKNLEQVIMFPIEMENPKTHNDMVNIVSDTLIRLNV